MDTTDSMITFNDNGVCDHCITYRDHTMPNWKTDDAAKLELEKLSDKIRVNGKNKDFDCIIGMSGGIDSSYLTHIATKQMGLRPLVYHVDAGWNSQIAVNNIEKLIDSLKLDLFTEVINWEEMKDLQLAFFKSGVPQIDTPQDHAFFATMYKFALKYNIKYILTGANLSTECVRNPIEWMYYQSDSVQIKDIHNRFGRIPLKTFPLTSILWHKVYLPYLKGIRVVRPLNLVTYIKEQAKEFLIKEYGWQPYPQKHFESRFTKFYESYWLPKRYGYDVRKVQFSSLILTGQMTRDKALQLLAKSTYDESTINREIEFVANKLSITVDELNGYLEIPKKTYKDYKSQRIIYELGARVMRALRLEVGGKR